MNRKCNKILSPQSHHLYKLSLSYQVVNQDDLLTTDHWKTCSQEPDTETILQIGISAMDETLLSPPLSYTEAPHRPKYTNVVAEFGWNTDNTYRSVTRTGCDRAVTPSRQARGHRKLQEATNTLIAVGLGLPGQQRTYGVWFTPGMNRLATHSLYSASQISQHKHYKQGHRNSEVMSPQV